MSAPLWTIAEVARALGLTEKYPDTPIDFVTQDSRLVKPGCLFVALSGTPSGGFISSFASADRGSDFHAARGIEGDGRSSGRRDSVRRHFA